MEDHCCFLGAYKALLPPEYRYENVRIRKAVADKEYPLLAPRKRKARLLDDLWPQLWALVPRLGNVVATIPSLQKMETSERSDTASHLTSELCQFDREFTALLNAPHVVELLEQGTCKVLPNEHRDCCPPLPFTPHVFEYPPAGVFMIVVQSIQCYMRSRLYPSLRSELNFLSLSEFEDHDASHYSVEICRTFAGVECSSSGSGLDVVFACFPAILMAALTCPSNLRMWVWCKLTHFEKLRQFCFEPIKKNLAMLWDMPNIQSDGINPWRGTSLECETRIITDEVDEDRVVELMLRMMINWSHSGNWVVSSD